MKQQRLSQTTITTIEVEEEPRSSTSIDADEIRLLNNKVPKRLDDNMSVKIILTFSAYTNIRKIFHIPKDENQLLCLHAIRFISLSWVVLGHTYLFNFGFGGFKTNRF